MQVFEAFGRIKKCVLVVGGDETDGIIFGSRTHLAESTKLMGRGGDGHH